jgi:hypothetical protein
VKEAGALRDTRCCNFQGPVLQWDGCGEVQPASQENCKADLGCSVKASTQRSLGKFTQPVSDTIKVEQALHKEYGHLWNMTVAEMTWTDGKWPV